MYKFINWKDLDLPHGKSKVKIKCPSCYESRTNKTDKSLQVNIADGYGKCHYCEALTFKEYNEPKEVKYIEPKQDWRNYTDLTDKLVKWLESERGIKQFAVKELGITNEKYYQPALKKEVNNIVFNYFEGDKIVNKKYRAASKHFTQSTGGKPMFYNINSAIGQKEVHIVEGEFDVVAMHQEGYKNVISVPNGANDNDAYWKNSEKYLKDVEKFLIAVDNDDKGNEFSEKIAQRLGRWRCVRVNWKGKDANEDLINGCFHESIKNISPYPVSGTFTTSDLRQNMLDLYNAGLPKTLEFKGDLKLLNNCFKMMFGHLVTGTGMPSHGKSNFTEWMVLNLLLENDYKASFFSPEHSPMEQHMSSFVQKIIGKPYFKNTMYERCTIEEVEQFIKWADQRLYLTSPDTGSFATWDWLLEKFKEQMFNYGINIFVIDAYNKVEHTGNKSERENITKVLSRLTQFAQQNNVLIILVAHPTKMPIEKDGLYRSPTLYDVSGSADFRNQTHDGYCVYRYFHNESGDGYTKFINLKTKYSYQGSIGESVNFNYDVPTGRFFPIDGQPNKENLLNPKPQSVFNTTQKEVFRNFTPQEAFDDLEELPF